MTRQPRTSPAIYVGSAVVLVLSFAATLLLPVPDIFRGLASIPGLGALLNIVVQLWRDQRAHERALDLLHRQQDIALATASHMANVAYDKHIAFCEAYINRTNKGLVDLLRAGPSKEALQFAVDLSDIRICHTSWLTAEIESKLIPFEVALRKMGASELLLESLPVGEQRSRVVKDIYKSFGVIVGVEEPGTDEEAAIAAARIVDHVRDVLGIKELTQLRLSAVRLALRRMSAGGD